MSQTESTAKLGPTDEMKILIQDLVNEERKYGDKYPNNLPFLAMISMANQNIYDNHSGEGMTRLIRDMEKYLKGPKLPSALAIYNNIKNGKYDNNDENTNLYLEQEKNGVQPWVEITKPYTHSSKYYIEASTHLFVKDIYNKLKQDSDWFYYTIQLPDDYFSPDVLAEIKKDFILVYPDCYEYDHYYNEDENIYIHRFTITNTEPGMR